MDATGHGRGGGGRGGGGSGVTRLTILATVLIVSLGYLMMWILLPTSLYKRTWKPKLKAKLNSTFFGTQGPNILIFTTPIILIALLGSIYAYFEKQSHSFGVIRKDEKVKWLARWRRPVLITGPLGVVSWIELSFILMFLALLIWSFSVYLHVGYGHITLKHGEKRWMAKWEVTVFRLGPTGNICLSFLFYPITRASTILPLFGLTSEASVKYHIWLGHTLMTLFTAHGLGYLLYWAVSGHLSLALKWKKAGISNIAGEISLLIGLILWVATIPRIRRKIFEVFLYTHYLYILFMLFFFFHVGISYAFYVLPGFLLFMIDRYVRFLQSKQGVRLLSARVLTCEVVELNFSKSPGLSYNPTSIIFVNIPKISKLQWHPFSISSSSVLENDRLSVIISVDGDWTRKAFDMVSSSSIDRLEASVEGPYGPVSNHLLRYDLLVMISGGSGITPYFSIIRELLSASTTPNSQIPKILLICSFKNSSDLSMLNLLLPLSSTTYDLSRLDLQIKAYVTREKTEIEENQTQPRTIWFKPNASDTPIFPSLGKNGYLWLGAIISSSFIGFLIIIGILTRYYIYPIDHNTNEIFATWERTILYLLILCVCIVITSSIVVIGNKKRNYSIETRQIISTEGVTPQVTPESGYYNADRELESLPYQSIIDFTDVHYGERPDLKLMLFGQRESSVGVLVCGPPALRHEVAAICGSGLAENLHFESLSFTW
ncbi:ferric reduction oxidase 2-like [Silene latifolia]|uniref:ferric reduction oxidase 2-like n=1 Tax=Silene latifolia TaxID=37657 RepID=UPI003D782A82